jgi:hypothetical protein
MAAFAKAPPIRKSPRESQASSGRSSDRYEKRRTVVVSATDRIDGFRKKMFELE